MVQQRRVEAVRERSLLEDAQRLDYMQWKQERHAEQLERAAAERAAAEVGNREVWVCASWRAAIGGRWLTSASRLCLSSLATSTSGHTAHHTDIALPQAARREEQERREAARLQALARAAAAEEEQRQQKAQRRRQKEAELQQRSRELEELRALKRRQQQMRADYARWVGASRCQDGVDAGGLGNGAA